MDGGLSPALMPCVCLCVCVRERERERDGFGRVTCLQAPALLGVQRGGQADVCVWLQQLRVCDLLTIHRL